MATLVLGLRPHETWSEASRGTDDSRGLYGTTSPNMSRINGAAVHHRSSSDVQDQHITRPRLPSISNFLEGAGRPGLPRHNFHSPTNGNLTFQNGPDMRHTTPLSPGNYHPWPPSEDIRQKQQLDPRPGYQSRVSIDHYPSDTRYAGRDDTVLSQLASADARRTSFSAVSLPQESAGADSRTTAKHVVREEHIPGKGMCYIYDDGSVCQKVINGDTVNPKWGTTKAGKPRKRLGQACNTCREKKIKCDPNYPKCSQCHKFNRECRFEPATRTGHKSPRLRPSTAHSMEDHSVSGSSEPCRMSIPPTDISSPSESGHLYAVRKLSNSEDCHDLPMLEGNFVRNPLVPTKRARVAESSWEYRSITEQTTSHDEDTKGLSRSAVTFRHDVDPMLVDSDLTKRCLEAYFSLIDQPKYAFIPYKNFMRWLETDQDKTSEARILVYSMMAVGALADVQVRQSETWSVLVSIVSRGVVQSPANFSLELIHARLIFAIHEYQLGNVDRAWDLCGSALRAACALNMNTEEGIRARSVDTPAAYGLDPVRLAECMRRTFWALFLQDQFGVACLGFGTTFSKADMFLQLPCSEDAYEQGLATSTPVFHVEGGSLKSDGLGQDPAMATLARQIHIASICCDIHVLATRTKHQASLGRSDKSPAARQRLAEQLDGWEREYSTHLASLNRSTGAQNSHIHIELFGGLHIVYHHACMELNRHIHHRYLTPREIADHAEKAYRHACRTLDIAHQLVSHGNTKIHDFAIASTSPVTGYAIMTALDILTAAGLNSDLLENKSRLMGRIMAGIEVLDTLAIQLASAKVQQETVSDRIKTLSSSVRAGVADRKIAFFVTEPMAFSLGHDDDLIYGVNRLQYLRATDRGDGVRSHSDLKQVRIQKETKR